MDLSHAPTAEVAIEGAGDWPLAVARVAIPAGGVVGNHDHGCSAVLLIPVASDITLTDENTGRKLELTPGSVVRTPMDSRVRVANPGEAVALVIMVFDPPDRDGFPAWPTDP